MSTIPLRSNTYQVEAYDTNLTASTFEDCLLAEARFTYCSLEQATLSKVRFDGARLDNISFENATMERIRFVNCAIRHGIYDGMTIEGVPVKALLNQYFEAHPEERARRLDEARAAGITQIA
jgi:uncharacterized protein YjbI with pentapeptide repeats